MYGKHYDLFIYRDNGDENYYGLAQGGWDDEDEFVPIWVFSAIKYEVDNEYELFFSRGFEMFGGRAKLNFDEKSFYALGWGEN